MNDSSVVPRISKLAVASVLAGCVPFGMVFLLILHNSCPCVEIGSEVFANAGLSGFFALFVAIILGYVARRSIRKKPFLLRGLKVAQTGLVMGYGWLTLLVWVLLFAPLRHGHPGANEASAVGSLRTIYHVVQDSTASHQDLPKTLQQMGQLGLIDRNLANGLKSGYQFTYQLRSTHNDGILDGFVAVAEPVAPCITGKRAFYIDDTDVIRFEVIHSDSKPTSMPTAQSPPL